MFQIIHPGTDLTTIKHLLNQGIVAFHRNALALVSRNLALPMGAANAAYASAGGLGVRVVYDYDATTKTDKISFDVIYGVKALDEDLICVLQG